MAPPLMCRYWRALCVGQQGGEGEDSRVGGLRCVAQRPCTSKPSSLQKSWVKFGSRVLQQRVLGAVGCGTAAAPCAGGGSHFPGWVVSTCDLNVGGVPCACFVLASTS